MTDLPLFEIEADRSGSHLTLTVHGEFDAAAAPAVIDAFVQHNSPPAELVSIDLSAVSFFDSSGLLSLQRLHQRSTAEGGSFTIVDASPTVTRILQLTGLDQVIPTSPKQTTEA